MHSVLCFFVLSCILQTFLSNRCLLQLLEDSVEDRLEKANSDSEKAEAENKELDPEDNKASS